MDQSNPAYSGCALLVGFGFPDNWRPIVPLLVLLLFFLFLVIIVVGVSRRHRVIHDGGKLPVGYDKNVLRHAQRSCWMRRPSQTDVSSLRSSSNSERKNREPDEVSTGVCSSPVFVFRLSMVSLRRPVRRR